MPGGAVVGVVDIQLGRAHNDALTLGLSTQIAHKAQMVLRHIGLLVQLQALDICTAGGQQPAGGHQGDEKWGRGSHAGEYSVFSCGSWEQRGGDVWSIRYHAPTMEKSSVVHTDAALTAAVGHLEPLPLV